MRVREAEWAAVDFESTGYGKGARGEPLQLGLAVWNAGEAGDFHRSMLRVEGRVAPQARAVHGLEPVEDAAVLLELWPEVERRLRGRVVLAHGGGTERRFLRVFPTHRFGPWVDTLTLARRFMPGLKSYALGEVAAALGVVAEVERQCPGLGWHDALFDAVATLWVWHGLVERLSAWDWGVEEII